MNITKQFNYLLKVANISSDLNKIASSPSNLIVVPPKSGSNTLSPIARESLITFPSRVVNPGPTAITSPSFALAVALSGSKIPPAV